MEEEKRSLLHDTEFQREIDNELTLGVCEKQMQEISHIYFYWGFKLSALREYAKQCQLDFDVFIAIKKQEAINKKIELMTPNEGARWKRDISGTAAKELVITMYEKEYREKLNLIFEYERKTEEMEKALKAIELKSFGLTQCAATLRKEYIKVQ